MTRETERESDYCDLTPGKICDNCCRCLDMEKEYNELEVSLQWTDRIVDGAYDDYEDDADDYTGQEGFDSSRVAPIEIDPALMAEWEGRLRAYEEEQKMAYMRTLHGARKRPQKLKGN